MDESQTNAIRIAHSGHNCLITGFPGTGKTFVLGQIVECLLLDKRVVQVTASTGKAALLLKSRLTSQLKACTIHSFLGLMDGRFSNSELLSHYQKEDYEHRLKRVRELEVLIIDEISMLSARLFEQIEFILRNVRQSERPFGGVQVILSGDFYQLPPVPSPEYGDDGSYIMQHPSIAHFHHINLTTIHRQEEPDLLLAVQEIACGKVCLDSRNLLARMGRSLPPEPASSRPTLHLFATNFEKDLHNAKCLQNLDGEEVIYKCQDSGEVKGIRGEKEIHIKVNCTVVLIVNLSDDLVNGLSGTVTETGKESVVVYFPDLNRTECIPFYNFTKYDPILKVDIGSRKQLPLTLGYALTVHKAQGVTVDRVVIECKNMFQYGQLTVAVSRVTKKKGLQLKNFSESLLKIPPKELTDFYQRTPLTVMDDKSCCSNIHVLNVNIQQVEISPEISEDPYDSSEDEDTLLEQVELIEKHLHPGAVTHHLPEDININSDILDTIPIVDPPELPQQVQEKEVLISLQQNQTELHTLIEFLWDEIYSMKEKHLKGERTTNKEVNEFYKDFNKFLSSKDYNARVTCMCTKQELSVSFFNVTFKISQRLRELVLKETVKPIIEKTTQMSEESTDEFTESPDGVGKIKYISGWCVNSVRKKKKKIIQANMYKKNRVKEIEKLIKEKNLLDHMEDRNNSKNNSFIDSKQNLRKGLCVVSEETLTFFLALDKKIRQLQSQKNVEIHGSHVWQFLKNNLLHDEKLTQMFEGLFLQAEACGKKCELKQIYDEIISKYSSMSVAQLRKEFLMKCSAKKKEATRKQIKVRTEKVKTSKLTFKTFLSDKSSTKLASHRKLQSELILDKSYLEKNFTKLQLHTLSRAYQINLPKTANTKKAMTDLIVDTVLSADNIVEPNAFWDDMPGPCAPIPATSGPSTSTKDIQSAPSTSTQETQSPPSASSSDITSPLSKVPLKRKGRCKGKGKGKGKKKKGSVKWPCGVCNNDASHDSVACDGCDTWYHGDCLQIEDLNELPDEWYCNVCKNNS